MMRFAFALLLALFASSVARAQTAFDPATVAYVLCVTNETKKFALEAPPLAKDEVVEKAFTACAHLKAEARKSLSEQGVSATIIDDRFTQIKTFIRQTAQDDIDRLRANSTKPR